MLERDYALLSTKQRERELIKNISKLLQDTVTIACQMAFLQLNAANAFHRYYEVPWPCTCSTWSAKDHSITANIRSSVGDVLKGKILPTWANLGMTLERTAYA